MRSSGSSRSSGARDSKQNPYDRALGLLRSFLTEEQLQDLPNWITQRVADELAEQESEKRRKRLRAKLARATGKTNSSGRTNPVHLQRSKHTLDELARRLEWTMAKHKAELGTFERRLLDHRSPHFISDRDGGIGSKGVILMANAITGQNERRS